MIWRLFKNTIMGVADKKWILVLRAVRKFPSGATARDVSRSLKITHVSAIQMLRLLRRWGHVLLAGYKPSDGGRPAHVFRTTNHGKKALKFHEAKEFDVLPTAKAGGFSITRKRHDSL